MTSEPSDFQAPAPEPHAAAAQPAVRRWDRGDAIVGTALVVLIISLFLPWFSGTVRFAGGQIVGGNATANGPRAHGYLWIVLVLAIAALAVLVTRDIIGRIPGNLPSSAQLLVGGTGLALLLSILGLAFRPPAFYAGPFGWTGYAPAGPHFAVSASWSYGGFVAVAAAAVAFVVAFVSAAPLQQASRTAQPAA